MYFMHFIFYFIIIFLLDCCFLRRVKESSAKTKFLFGRFLCCRTTNPSSTRRGDERWGTEIFGVLNEVWTQKKAFRWCLGDKKMRNLSGCILSRAVKFSTKIYPAQSQKFVEIYSFPKEFFCISKGKRWISKVNLWIFKGILCISKWNLGISDGMF